jgi:predicted site-specific integrase-resolvase
MKMDAQTAIIAPTAAAQVLGVSYKTLIAICDRGEIDFTRATNGTRLFTRSALDSLRRRRERDSESR